MFQKREVAREDASPDRSLCIHLLGGRTETFLPQRQNTRGLNTRGPPESVELMGARLVASSAASSGILVRKSVTGLGVTTSSVQHRVPVGLRFVLYEMRILAPELVFNRARDNERGSSL